MPTWIICGVVTLLPHTPSCSGQKWLTVTAWKDGMRDYVMWSGDCESLNRLADLRVLQITRRYWMSRSNCWHSCSLFWMSSVRNLARGLLTFTNHILTLHGMSCWERRSTNTSTTLYITRPSSNELFNLQPYWILILSSFWNVLSSLSLLKIFNFSKTVSIYVSDLATFNRSFNCSDTVHFFFFNSVELPYSATVSAPWKSMNRNFLLHSITIDRSSRYTSAGCR